MSRSSLALLLVAGLMVVPAGSAAANAGGASAAMVSAINHARAQHGLPALRHAPTLSRSSTAFARRLMAQNVFGHDNWIHASSRFTRLGETLSIGRGFRLRPRLAVRGWLGSPSHRFLLLDRGFRFVGAGPARGLFSGQRSTLWVAHFGRR